MNIIGVELKKPTFWGVTRAAIFATIVWCIFLYLGINNESLRAMGALLLCAMYGALSSECGIHVLKGGNHLALNLIFGLGLLGIYHMLFSLFT